MEGGKQDGNGRGGGESGSRRKASRHRSVVQDGGRVEEYSAKTITKHAEDVEE